MQNQTSTVIVTGAAGGMGSTVSSRLAAGGWHVLAIDHNKERLSKVATSHSAITPLLMDLTDPNLADQTLTSLNSLPPIAGLVNLAGKSQGDSIDHLTDIDWDHSFAINVTAAMCLIRAISPRLRAQKYGSIVNVGSPVGLIGARKASYAASKAALHGLTMSCARELGQDNIRVNLLLPGPTITEMTRDWDSDRRASIAGGSFLKRLCTPHDIAGGIAFLLSKDSAYMTGSVLDMTAGTLWGH